MISGTTHVGRRTMDSKVGLGENRTPKMRLKELSEAAGGGMGVAASAIEVLLFAAMGDAVSLRWYGSFLLKVSAGAILSRIFRGESGYTGVARVGWTFAMSLALKA